MKIGLGAILLLCSIFFVIDYAWADDDIPGWLKQNAIWWAEGRITDREFTSSLQYLFDVGILQDDDFPSLPFEDISEVEKEQARDLSEYYRFGKQQVEPIPFELDVPAREVNVLDRDYRIPKHILIDDYSDVIKQIKSFDPSKGAKYFVVTLFDGPIATPIQLFGFPNFQTTTDPDPQKFSFITTRRDPPKFMIESVPNPQYSRVYDAVNYLLFEQGQIKPFRANVDVISESGELIQQWRYQKCMLMGYGTYLQEVRNLFQMSDDNTKSEIRDRYVFECAGVRLITSGYDYKGPGRQ